MQQEATKRFRAAVERKEASAVLAMFAPGIRFHGVSTGVFEGAEVVGRLVPNLLAVLKDLHYIAELHGDDTVALVFEATIGEVPAHGVDLLNFDESGLVREFTAFLRPGKAVQALVAAMRGERADYQADASPEA